MATISAVLRRIKTDLQVFLPDDLVREACRQAGHSWRCRQFDPVLTLHLFILQILHFNTALTHLRHLSKLPITAAAYCKARIGLPLPALQMLLRQSAAAMRNATGVKTSWQGLRTWLVDGSSTIAPDTAALDKAFGHSANQREGCSFPVPKLLGLFDAFSGLVAEILCLPLVVHEQAHVWKLHPLLRQGDLLVGDRGFCSYVHLAMLRLRDIQGCFRLHQRTIVSFRVHRKSHRKGQTGKLTPFGPSC